MRLTSDPSLLGSHPGLLRSHPGLLGYLPSPSRGVWHLGPLPIRAYALAIILGVVVAMIIANKRWLARGGRPGTIADVATWCVPVGLIGARLYNVVSDPELYFLHGEDPWRAFAIWDGGLGIWGAVAAGALTAWWLCRRRGMAFGALADATAPAIAVAQAIGRFGNYFNQELFGRATSLPWGLTIDPAHRPADMLALAHYQPTFLYESLWDLGTAAVVIWADRRYRLAHGRAFALYIAVYVAGRSWVEALRVDHANHILGLRLNDWTSIIVFLGAVAYLYRSRGATREQVVQPEPAGPPAPPESPAADVDPAPVAGSPSRVAASHETTTPVHPRDGP